MRPHRDGASPAQTGPTPVTAPGTPVKKPKAFVHLSMKTAKRNAVGSRRTAPHFPIRTSDAAAWAIVTLVVGIILIAGCVLLTLGAPS